jgi:hypothetical protein
MNTITGAWCKFTGWFANAWAVFEERLYFASDTKVAEAWTGPSDFGAAIVGRAQQAYNYFGQRAMQKHFKLLRPMLTVDGAITLYVGFNVDYAHEDFVSEAVAAAAQYSVWDTGLWDQAIWGPDNDTKKDWLTVFAPEGYAAAFRLQVATTSVSIRWSATDFVFERGGVL